ncbi:MAG: hypothetical protein V4697_00700 [Patescibacteria group bacterium]
MATWKSNGPYAGLRDGLEQRRFEEQRRRALERQKAGKAPPPGPVTKQITSRRKRVLKLATGPLTRWIQSGGKSNTQG